MLDKIRKMFRGDKVDEKQTILSAFQELLDKYFVSDGKPFTLKHGIHYSIKWELDHDYKSLLGDKLPEYLLLLNTQQLEQVYLLCLLSRKLLLEEIETTFYIWLRAYDRYLQLMPKDHYWLTEGEGLFLFGYNRKFKIVDTPVFSDYKQFAIFLKENPSCRFDITTYNRWLWNTRDGTNFLANDFCLRRISDMLLLATSSTANYQKNFMWQAYFILLLNSNSESEKVIKYLKSLDMKSEQFKMQLERIEKIAALYKADRRSGYWFDVDSNLYKEQVRLKLQQKEPPTLINILELKPRSLNWHFSVRFSTNDFSKCNEVWERPNLTEKDALLELHIFSTGKWLVDLQWYLPSEKVHNLRRPSHDRPRVIWRNMCKWPISYQLQIKDKSPHFDEIKNFPHLVNQLKEIFELDFRKTAEILVKGIEIKNKKIIQDWLGLPINEILEQK